jgi:hypothetical protein
MSHVNMISPLNKLPPRKRGGLLPCEIGSMSDRLMFVAAVIVCASVVLLLWLL